MTSTQRFYFYVMPMQDIFSIIISKSAPPSPDGFFLTKGETKVCAKLNLLIYISIIIRQVATHVYYLKVPIINKAQEQGFNSRTP